MQRTDAVSLFAHLLSLYPNAPEMRPEAQAYWLAMLERLPAEVGRDTAEMAAQEFKFFPSVAEWQALARRARAAYADEHGLPEPHAPRPADHKSRLAELRDTLSAAHPPSPHEQNRRGAVS